MAQGRGLGAGGEWKRQAPGLPEDEVRGAEERRRVELRGAGRPGAGGVEDVVVAREPQRVVRVHEAGGERRRVRAAAPGRVSQRVSLPQVRRRERPRWRPRRTIRHREIAEPVLERAAPRAAPVVREHQPRATVRPRLLELLGASAAPRPSVAPEPPVRAAVEAVEEERPGRDARGAPGSRRTRRPGAPGPGARGLLDPLREPRRWPPRGPAELSRVSGVEVHAAPASIAERRRRGAQAASSGPSGGPLSQRPLSGSCCAVLPPPPYNPPFTRLWVSLLSLGPTYLPRPHSHPCLRSVSLSLFYLFISVQGVIL